MLSVLDERQNLSDLGFYNFHPRPDQPGRYDEQKSFMDCDKEGLILALGGNGCLAAEQEVYDPVACISRRVDSIDGPFHVWARNDSGERVIANAEQPRICGRERLYEITLAATGERIRATLDHRILDASYNWQTVRQLYEGSLIATSPQIGPHVGRVEWIDEIEFLREDVYWDFHVPIYENYWMEGIWHHNSGKSVCALVKAVEFLLHAPKPPNQRDHPFWFISNTFQQVMDICWKEKLHGFGILPPQFIDWSRIRWHDRKSDWPHAVPLIDHPGAPGRNFLLEFKSADQGRETFQGSDISGFCFTEQFTHDLLVEVMARCRAYGGKANKIAEFCPINPEKSIWLQQMDEGGTIPDSWGMFHMNTECAVEAGHFDRAVFRDMFAMVPKAMRDTRMKGLWGSYEGLVYPEFNAAIHCIAESDWEMPPAVYHRKAIDYGQGPENPFACIWMCRDGQGRWTAYDEYYSTEPISPIEHLKRIQDQEVLWPDSPYYGMTWADPSALGAIRIAARLQDYAPGYRSMNIQGANHNRDEGINHVRWLLDVHDELIGPNGKPQPMLSIVKEKCPNLIKEFRTHRYLQSSGLGLNPASARLDVLKRDDHLLDCCRYLCYSEHLQTGVTPQMIQRERATPKGMQFESKKFKRGGRTLE